jgi:glycosyltransferase involved in cell wall biosynthesis
MAKKICLISDHHVSVNPRLWKEAFVYEQMGLDVVILTQWTSDYFLEKDRELLRGHAVRYEAYLDMRPGHASGASRFYYRMRKRIGGELKKRLNVSKAWAVSYAPALLYRRALAENADMYSAHLEAGFIAGGRLVQAGRTVGFDLEDWYSRDYVTPDRVTPLLHAAEGFALTKGRYFTTTSQAMAEALRQTWKTDKPITVIYNSFPDEAPGDASDILGPRAAFRLVWTSRTIGPNRGLETLVAAIALVDQPVELHLIGMMAPGYGATVSKAWPAEKGHRLVVHDFVRHHELQGILANCDLGIAVEQRTPDSRNKTITNKILQYIQAGLRVLATDTDGQQEVAERFPESIFVVPAGQPGAWAEAITLAMQAPGRSHVARQQETYAAEFSWPVQAEKIRQLINQHLYA